MENTSRPVIALGTFDGLHPGHRAVINAMLKTAGELNASSMVYTFIENPRSLFGAAPRQLMTPGDKARALKAMGVERVESAHFTRELAALTPEAFVDLLCGSYSPLALVCGEDYSFGAGGQGSSQTLARLARERGIGCVIVPTVKIQTKVGNSDIKVSSTLIREALERGDGQTADKLLRGEAI